MLAPLHTAEHAAGAVSKRSDGSRRNRLLCFVSQCYLSASNFRALTSEPTHRLTRSVQWH